MDRVPSLQRRWIWAPNWVDYGRPDEAGRIVHFRKTFSLDAQPIEPHLIDISADTRYTLRVNGTHVAYGPARGSDRIWYFDYIDLAPYLRSGENEVLVTVLRYFYGVDAAAPFGRSWLPGLAIQGHGLDTDASWECRIDREVSLPTGIKDDIFLHIFERVAPVKALEWQAVAPYRFGVKSGENSPWVLAPRMIRQPFMKAIQLWQVRDVRTDALTSAQVDWAAFLKGAVRLPAGSTHLVELEAPFHLNAFMRWTWSGRGHLKVTYSEGYEGDREGYPSLRSKSNRREPGKLVGPHDSVVLQESASGEWNPFWYRTFRFLVVEVVAESDLELGMSMRRTGYPLEVVASWSSDIEQSEEMWEVSVRTMQNCLVDGFSDCPFYEQLQYAMDTRSSAMFHYLLSADDSLARQAMVAFQASQTPEGVLLSRYPARQDQLISGFSLFWVKMVEDHHLFFGDAPFAKGFIATIDRVLAFFERHVGSDGLVGRLPASHWKFIDWVTEWAAPEVERGTPAVGARTGVYSYFSMLYAWTLRAAARLLRRLNYRISIAEEYDSRADALTRAVRALCFDGRYFTDSYITEGGPYSANAQIWGILCGASNDGSLLDNAFPKPSYVMQHYAFRAMAQTGVYERHWDQAWEPWRRMLALEMSTWEEDALSQRSDCHAWGSLPLYEYTIEVAGLAPISSAWQSIAWGPRTALSERVRCVIPLPSSMGGNAPKATATVAWDRSKGQKPKMVLSEARHVVLTYQGVTRDCGRVREVECEW